MDLSSLLNTVGIVATALFGLLAFRFVATFDFNRWQERNDAKMHVRLKNACPHFSLIRTEKDGKHDVEIKPLFVATFETTDWSCVQCNTVFPGGVILPSIPTNIQETMAILEQQEDFRKLVRKAGLS